jgi:hypothetical protein
MKQGTLILYVSIIPLFSKEGEGRLLIKKLNYVNEFSNPPLSPFRKGG